MTKPLEAVLFDLDGTLLDTVALILTSMRHATEKVLNKEMSDYDLMEHVGKPLTTQMQIFDSEKADELVMVYREHNAQVHDDLIGGYPGVLETLVELKRRGIPMGVVTSKSHAMALRGLDMFELTDFFEIVIGYDDVEYHKPDPFPLEFAATAMDVDIKSSIYIGDSPHDMNAAISAGAISVAALWGAFSAEDVLSPNPQHSISSMEELIVLIDRLTFDD